MPCPYKIFGVIPTVIAAYCLYHQYWFGTLFFGIPGLILLCHGFYLDGFFEVVDILDEEEDEFLEDEEPDPVDAGAQEFERRMKDYAERVPGASYDSSIDYY